MEKDLKKIKETECNPKFLELMDNRMLMGYYTYGPVADNYGKGIVSAIKSLEKRLNEYLKTGNTEFLVDVANFARIEFTHPQHPRAHFRATDNGESPGIVGTSIREMTCKTHFR